MVCLTFIGKMPKPFQFKQFSVAHEQSAHKVGTDGVLLGAWVHHPHPQKILDVGSGSGLIALMLAQRFRDADISGVELHSPSAREATENFASSPFSKRLNLQNQDYLELPEEPYDLIVSNPPFFEISGQTKPDQRQDARQQARLDHEAMLSKMSNELKANGRLGLILPFQEGEKIIAIAKAKQLYLNRLCRVRSYEDSKVIRLLMEFSREQHNQKEEELFLYQAPGQRSEAYQELCAAFYL